MQREVKVKRGSVKVTKIRFLSCNFLISVSCSWSRSCLQSTTSLIITTKTAFLVNKYWVDYQSFESSQCYQVWWWLDIPCVFVNLFFLINNFGKNREKNLSKSIFTMNNDTYISLTDFLLPSTEIDLLYENNETTTPASIPFRTTTEVALSTPIGTDHPGHSSPPLEVRIFSRLVNLFPFS